MANANRRRRPGNRGKGGRPPKPLKQRPDNSPNPSVLAMRAQMGLTSANEPLTPLGVARKHGWLTPDDLSTAARFVSLHSGAALEGPRVPAQGDLSNPEAVDVRAITWAQLSDKEIAAIWESALRDVRCGPANDREGFAAEAMFRWKAACNAMTPDQRREVVRFCIDDSWPQWIVQRCAGEMNSPWERQRDLLVGGLRAIAAATAARRESGRA